MRTYSNLKYVFISAILLTALLTGCKNRIIPLDKVETKDMYGAWKSEYSSEDTRYMLFYKNNKVYQDAAEEDVIVILSVTPTDTLILYSGSFEIVEGYLHTFNSYSNYANELLEFTKAKFTLYYETAPNYMRVYEKTKTDLLDEAPSSYEAKENNEV
ncbi:MAG: hypothetical protein C0596_15360 [Marinilabiliales bacterium]|nr:MAG: hypothetical protein C0596_15360 [Marinilabiliales bacterium]